MPSYVAGQFGLAISLATRASRSLESSGHSETNSISFRVGSKGPGDSIICQATGANA